MNTTIFQCNCTTNLISRIIAIATFLILANHGSLQAQVQGKCFIDINQNGIFDKNESLLSDVQLRVYKVNKKYNHNLLFGNPPEELLIETKTNQTGEFVLFPDFYPARIEILIEGNPYQLVMPTSYTNGDIGLENGIPYRIIRNKGEVLLPLKTK